MRTLPHLRPRQIAYRLIRSVQPAYPAGPPAFPGADPEKLAVIAEALVAWGPDDSDARLKRAMSVRSHSFRFLNHSETISPINWRRTYVSRLWTYNLHYFDFALDLAWAFRLTGEVSFVDCFRLLATSWVTDAEGGPGWESYPTSVRIQNWVFAAALFGEAIPEPARGEILGSVFRQTWSLERRLEWHLLGNHPAKNLCAIAVSSLVYSGAHAERWRNKGRRDLWKQLQEQALSDGCHCERSPMYHALFTADFLQLAGLLNRTGDHVPVWVATRLRAMVSANQRLTRSDGSLHLFQDTANGVAPSLAYLRGLSRAVLGDQVELQLGGWALPDSAYYGYNLPDGESLLIDAGEPSPEYQPGHAHASLLAFELDLGGRAVLVGPGVSGYDADPLREYVRSTRAHNTITIGDRDQSEMWATFRIARRARRTSVAVGGWDGARGFLFSAGYRPYHDRALIHTRRFQRDPTGLLITDSISGGSPGVVRSYLHFHPDFDVSLDQGSIIAAAGVISVRIEPFGATDITLHTAENSPAQGWHCPEFGLRVPATAVMLTYHPEPGGNFGYRIRIPGGSSVVPKPSGGAV